MDTLHFLLPRTKDLDMTHDKGHQPESAVGGEIKKRELDKLPDDPLVRKSSSCRQRFWP